MLILMKARQEGFSVIELILILLVVSAMGFMGWFVWHHNVGSSAVHTKSNTNVVPANGNIISEMKLPFKKTVIYLSKDGGCHTFSGNTGPYTDCYKKTLVFYTPSGNLQADESSIAEQFVQQKRGWHSVSEVQFPSVPFSLSVNQFGSDGSVTGNAGLCLIIIDKSGANPEGCGEKTDFQALRAKWPDNNAAYAIGVIYITYR